MTESAPMVFVVDDDPSMLRALERMLRTSGHSAEVYASPGAFLARPRYPGPACLITDLRMPGMSGLELQQALLASGYRIPIIFISGHGDIPTTVKAVKAVLPKPFAREELLASVESALRYHREALAEQAANDERRSKFALLTPREQEVCVLVGRGLLNKQIAAELGAAEKTIKVHRARVMAKLAVGSVAELVDLLREIGER
ncbi:MAG: response regulator transcription factor [Acidobacteria bacterium]|nr:response regulator transcription factor [Acidobacteriota bacterium]